MISSNKKSIALAIVALSLVFMVGCSSSNKALSDSSNSAKSTNGASNSANVSTANTSSTDSSSANNVTNSSGNNSSNGTQGTETDSQVALLNSITTLAQQGKIINSDFPASSTSIQTIESKLGKADTSEWVAQAKGTYYTYSKQNVVFGINRDQLFEVRSFDSRLAQISLSMVKNTLGNPAYNTTSGGDQIIGYTAGKDFKILFVFSKSTNDSNDPMLDHYSVLYPRGSANDMGNDPGRQW